MVRKLFIDFLNRVAALFKGEGYRIDPNLPVSALFEYLLSKVFALLRCLMRGVVISVNPRKLVFLGPAVELKNRRMIHFGRGVTLGRSVMIDGLSIEGIVIGDGSSIGPYGMIRATGVLSSVGVGFKLGSNSSMDAFAFVGASGGVVVGSNVIMGQKVSFHSENHLYDRLDVPIRHQGTTRQGIVVEDDCWIGSNVTFLDGAHVASGCVIGAGSVVRGYIPANSIAVGVPARVIKSRGAVAEKKNDE
ncbi:MAG: acyltransferase [Gallionella sp.]|jgi:acetyltransferase-like isoleucine patch superfamily enzyme